MIRPRHASHITVGALALAALLLPAFAAAQPSLAYDPPASWTRGPYSSPWSIPRQAARPSCTSTISSSMRATRSGTFARRACSS